MSDIEMMASVLAEHRETYVVEGYRAGPGCTCGEFLGAVKPHADHEAEVLVAAGFGRAEEADNGS